MNTEISENLRGKTVAVAVSGGADSMALLHFVANFCGGMFFNVVALNVEHGIRGASSVKDSAFVKNYCLSLKIPILEYKVNAKKKAETDKISLEQAARALRYECFFDAIKSGKCDAVFTAHHSADNLESVLFNLFRGTGVKGLIGIKDYGDKIYRPFLKVSKEEIAEYVKQNGIPFVNDETNLCDDYTRNFLRLNVIPKIKEIFPEAEKSVLRLSETLKEEDCYLDAQSKNALNFASGAYFINIDVPRAIMSRAAIIAVKNLGLTHDYEKTHIDDILSLTEKENGKTVNLPRGIKAVKEYDRITIYKELPQKSVKDIAVPFNMGQNDINGNIVNIIPCENITEKELKNGFYADFDKIPKNAVIRCRKTGDKFTKFGGGTKSLSDFLTDKKIPKKDRDKILILANGNDVLAIIGVAVSDKIKVDKTTIQIIKFL